MKIRKSSQGFTLIELLVVISIIAILASIAVPTMMNQIMKGKMTKDMINAKEVYKGLIGFAMDHDGAFPNKKDQDSSDSPSDIADANDAYANLIPKYIPVEKIFYTPNSRWCNSAPPDENISSATEKLKGGENSYAYVSGLNNTSNANFPLVADGFSQQTGVYSKDPNVTGGVWKGLGAIVVRCDGSASIESLRDDLKVYGNTGSSTKKDIFATSGGDANNPWLSAQYNKIYNPRQATNP